MNRVQDISHRRIVHLDVDSFYVACEIRRSPSLKNKAVAITQFNSGGFVAVSKEAKMMGVRKGDGIGRNGQKELAWFKDRPDALLPAVLKRCPDLKILPMDTSYYRKCTALLERTIENAPIWKILNVRVTVERVSCDDFFVDLTDAIKSASLLNNYTDGDQNDSSSASESDEEVFLYNHHQSSPSPKSRKSCPTYLNCISIYDTNSKNESKPFTPIDEEYTVCWIVHELRTFIVESSGMTVSAGIARNKLLARLVSKRPLMSNTQTLLRASRETELLRWIPIRRVPGLKRKLGEWLEESLSISTLHELASVPLTKLTKRVSEEKARMLQSWGRGEDMSNVLKRAPPKSILVERSFSPKQFSQDVVSNLAKTLLDRLHEDGRDAKSLVISYRIMYENVKSRSFSMPRPLSFDSIINRVVTFFQSFETSTLTRIALSATKFQNVHYKSGSVSIIQKTRRKANATEQFRVQRQTPTTTKILLEKKVSNRIQKELCLVLDIDTMKRASERIVICLDQVRLSLFLHTHHTQIYTNTYIHTHTHIQDCFYAQVVMLQHPELREKPLAITQKNIIVTCNYPARDFGVKKLMLIRDAVKLCPQLVMVSGERLDQFRTASRQIWGCVRRHMEMESMTYSLERSGLDELFIDITLLADARVRQGEDRYTWASKFSKDLRQIIFKECGFQCCAGISNSKLGAKVAVNMKKPNDQFTLRNILPVLLPMKLEHLYGVGRRTCQSIRASFSNVISVRDCLTLSLQDLNDILKNSKLSRYVYLAVRGVDLKEVNHENSWEQKSLSVEDSMRSCESLEIVLCYLNRLSEDLVKRMDEDGRIAQNLTLKVRIRSGTSSVTKTCSERMPVEISQIVRLDFVRRVNVLHKLASNMFRKHFKSPFKTTLLSLTASNFSKKNDSCLDRQRSIVECMSSSSSSPSSSRENADEVSYLSQISDSVLSELPASLQKEILDRKKRVTTTTSISSSSSGCRMKKKRKVGRSRRNIKSYFSKK